MIVPHSSGYGQITHTAAETNNGVYQVNVDVTVGSDTDSQSFEWIVNHTNLLGWIDDQVHGENESVSVFVNYEYGLANGDSPTYSATGLPDGLWIDENTGEIYGMVQAQAPGITQFTTTVTATDSSGVHNQTFTWNILSGTDPIVMFAINDTYTNIDDVTLVNPQLPLDVGVKLYAPNTSGTQVIDLAVPSGLSSLNVSSISLAHGQTGTVTLTPLQVSTVDDDVVLLAFMGGQQVGQGKGVNLDKIEILTNGNVGKISAANTPSGMPDRVPPRVDTEYQVKYYGANTTKEFKLKVVNQSNDNGQVKLWANNPGKYFGGVNETMPQYPANYTQVGNARLYTSYLNGTSQTKPGNAGKLKVAVFHSTEQNLTDTKAIAISAGFSVSAIPDKVEVKFHKIHRGDSNLDNTGKVIRIGFGVGYRTIIHSDSGNTEDLDQIQFREQVIADPTRSTGALKNVKSLTSGWLEFKPAPLLDVHARTENAPLIFQNKRVTLNEARVAAVQIISVLRFKQQGPGKSVVMQYQQFADSRSGLTINNAKAIPNSGFEIVLEIKKNTNGEVAVFVTK